MVEYEYRNIDMNDLGGDINTITYQEELESVD
jgi:hypothetical protein